MNPVSIEQTSNSISAGGGLIQESSTEDEEQKHSSLDLTTEKPINIVDRLGLRRRKRHQPSSKRLSFRDRPDFIKSRYFFYTFFYAWFFIVGAGWGYSAKGNLFCLIISGFIGLMFLLFSIVHGYDYYNGAPLESMYISVPFSK